MTRRTTVVSSSLLLAGFLGLAAACLPSLLTESEFEQLGGIAPNPELDDGYSRRALRSTNPPVPPLGSTTTITFQIQFDGLTLSSDSAVEDFKAAYCADLVSATREESSFCHVAEITPSGSSGILVTTGLYYPEPIPPTALNPDTLAAGVVVSPAFFFSPAFKEAYGSPARGENVVVNSIYVPPPPDIPPEPPSQTPPPEPPAPSGNSGTNGKPIPPTPIMWWDISPPLISSKEPSAPPQPSSPGVPAQLPPSPLSPWSLPPRPSPPSPPAPPTPREPTDPTAPGIPLSPETRPSPPAPLTPGAPSNPTAPGTPGNGAGGADGSAGSPPTPSRPGSPSSEGPDQIGCTQMAEIESLLASQIRQLKEASPSGKCELGCLLEHFPTTLVTATGLRCAFNTVKCLDARRTGRTEEAVFLGTILRLLSCTMGGTPETSGNGENGNSGNGGSQDTSGNGGSQVPWGSGTMIPFIEAIQAVIESPSAGDSTPEIVCDAVTSLRLVSEIQLRAILDAIELKDSSAYMLDTVGMALERFAPKNPAGSSLAGYSDPVTGDSDQTRCSQFPLSLNRIFNTISEAVLGEMLTSGETEDIGPESVRLKLSLQDIHGNSQGLKFSFPAQNRYKRHRALASMEASAPIPEIDMPGSFSEACIATPLACPKPLPISLSYTAESTYLMLGLGTAIFVSAAADSANVSTAGLMVAPVSGTIGIRLPFSSDMLSTGLLGTSALLQFPLDGQVSGALGKDGKLCMRMDYDLMLPVVIGPPDVASGVATCAATSAGDYLVVQLAYALEDTRTSPGTYIATRGVHLEPIYDNPPKLPSRKTWTLLYACLSMAAVALCIIVVLWLRDAPHSSEDDDAWMYEGEEEGRLLMSPRTLEQEAGRGGSTQPTKPSSLIAPEPAVKKISWLNDDASPPIAIATTPEDPSVKAFKRVSSVPLANPSRDPGAMPEAPSRQAFKRLSSLLPGLPNGPPDSMPEAPPRQAFKRLSSLLPGLPNGPPDPPELATANGEEQMVQKIVKMHVQGRRDRKGRTALHLAIVKRNFAAVQALTQPLGKHQSSLDDTIFSDGSMQDSSMRNPLHTAAETGELEIFQHLLTLAGSNVQQAVSLRDVGGNTVLHLAARKGHIDIIAALQGIPGCDLKIDAQNRSGWTALQLATSKGDLEMVVQLLKSNPDIDLTAGKEPRGLKDIVCSSRSALHIASMLGRRDIVKALLGHMHKAVYFEQGIEYLETLEPVKTYMESSLTKLFQNFGRLQSFRSVPEPEKEEAIALASTITMASMRKLVGRSSARQAAGPPRRHAKNDARRKSTGNGEQSPNEGDVFLDDVTTDE